MSEDRHVIPLAGRKHETSASCWCKPRVDKITTKGIVWVHSISRAAPQMN